MKVVKESFSSQIEVKKSIFIAHLVPFSKFNSTKEQLKLKHKKANHIVWAYRKINQFNQIEEGSSDDGEPKGCAGVPALNVLRGEELVDVGVLIVRYFGGIKLGTGGMARAYSQATKSVIEVAKLKPYQKIESFEFESSYKALREIEYHLKSLNILEVSRDFQADRVKWRVLADTLSIQRLKELLS